MSQLRRTTQITQKDIGEYKMDRQNNTIKAPTKTRLPKLAHIDQLIVDGQPHFGVFALVERINYLDYHSHLISQKAVSQRRKQFKANQFAFVQIVQPPYRICMAIATIKLASTVFAYIYNEHTGEFEVVEALQPLTHNSEFSGDHRQGRMSLKQGKLSLVLQFSESGVQLDLVSKQFAVSAQLGRSDQPLAVCSPSGRRGWSFTQKEPLTVIRGTLTFFADSKHYPKLADTDSDNKADNRVDNKLSGDKAQTGLSHSLPLKPHALVNLDWTLGFMRHETNWFWSCITTELPDGRTFMLNLSMGVNETGVSENACWIDGQIYYLPPVLFSRQSDLTGGKQPKCGTNPDEPRACAWQVSHLNLGWSDVEIELSFTPISVYKKMDNYGVIASVFEQWIGTYCCHIKLSAAQGGHVVALDNVMGLAEDHFAKW